MAKIEIIDTSGERYTFDEASIRTVTVQTSYGKFRVDFGSHLRVTALKSNILIIPVASNVIDIGEANA